MEIEPYETEFFYDKYGLKIWEKRHSKVLKIISKINGVQKLLDLGCNTGKFLKKATKDLNFELLIGLDISKSALKEASYNLEPNVYDYSLKYQRSFPLIVKLFCGDAIIPYSVLKICNFDVITLIELIEHIEFSQMESLEKNVFGFLNPANVIITTPNYDFNYFFNQNKNEKPSFRDLDHKYELTRKEFQSWAKKIEGLYDYEVKFDGVGLPKTNDNSRGYCSQIAIFTRKSIFNNKIFDIENDKKKNSFLEEIFTRSYPFEEKNHVDFLRIIKQTYNAIRLIRKKLNETRFPEKNFKKFPFISIEDLMKMSQIKEITHDDITVFFELLKKINIEKENLQVTRNKKAIRFTWNYKIDQY